MKKFFRSILGTSLLLAGALLVASFASCKDPNKGGKGGGGVTKKDFEVTSIKLWGNEIKDKTSVEVKGTSTDKSLVVTVGNVDAYEVVWSFDGGDSGTTVGSAKEAKEDPFNVAIGESTLNLKLVASGFNEWSKSIKVTFKAPSADVVVKLKRGEDAQAFEITEGGEYETKGDDAELELETTTKNAELASVTAGSATLTLDGTKKAKGKVGVGTVEVVARFKGHKEFKFTFTLKKLDPGQTLKLKATRATIFSGKDWGESLQLSLGEDNEYDEVNPKNVMFSIVKLVMEFDAPLKKVEFTLSKNERTPNYIDSPQDSDLAHGGIFSGRVVKELKCKAGGQKPEETVLENISGNKYTEYLILGSGEVNYKIKFSADGREDVEYTINLKDTKRKVYEIKKGQQAAMGMFNGYETFGLGVGGILRWVGYIKTPVRDMPDNQWADAMSNPQYQGDNIGVAFSANKAMMSTNGYKDYNYFYNIMSVEKKEDIATFPCHEFVRVIPFDSNGRVTAFVRIKPDEKFIDAFIGTDTQYPLPLLPLHMSNKFKKLVPKGFYVDKLEKLGDEEEGFPNAFHLRNQSVIFGEQNNNGTHVEGKELKVYQVQEWEDWFEKAQVKTRNKMLIGKTGNKLSDRDVFVLQPLFDGKFSDNFTKIECKVSKKANGAGDFTSESGWDLTYDLTKWDNAPFLILATKDAFLEKWQTAGSIDKVTNLSDIFTLEGDSGKSSVTKHIYKVELTCTLKDGTTKEYFDFIFDFSENGGTQNTLSVGGNAPSLTTSDLSGLRAYLGDEQVMRMPSDIARDMARMDYFKR